MKAPPGRDKAESKCLVCSLSGKGLAVLGQAGARLLVPLHAVVLHHTVQEGNEVLILT